MSEVKTETLLPDPDGIARAAALLADGALVALPTETVYGLAGDARNDRAVAGIFAAKGRPAFNPLIIHLPDLHAARAYAHFDEAAEKLASAFWPGPLTMVLPLRPDAGISPLVTAGNDTVAIRVPAHPVAQALLRAFGGPVAAPSANMSGKISATSADHVLDGLSGRVAAVVDGGPCAVGVESTIVGCAGGPTLLRPGGISVEDIETTLGTQLAARDASKINAPGQLTSHYAPNALMRLNVTDPAPDEVWLGFGPECGEADLNLSPSGDLLEAAANLFHAMRQIDVVAGGDKRIAVAPVPMHGLGLAINDRLSRAAAPRD